eukprot:EG_transcript_24581
MADGDLQPKPVAVQTLRRVVDATLELRPDNQPPGWRPSFPTAPGDGVRLALQLLLYHPLDSHAVRVAVGALLDLLPDGEPEPDVRRLLNLHGLLLLTTSLLRHGACRPLVLDGTALLCAVLKVDRAKMALAEQATLLPLLQALGQWKSDAEVIAGGLAVLLRLSVAREGRLSLIVLGVIELVLRVLLLHPNSLAVQVPGCAFLHNMALAAPALPRLRAAGAVEAAAAAVRSFPGDRRLLGQALPALHLLCSKSERPLTGADELSL